MKKYELPVESETVVKLVEGLPDHWCNVHGGFRATDSMYREQRVAPNTRLIVMEPVDVKKPQLYKAFKKVADEPFESGQRFLGMRENEGDAEDRVDLTLEGRVPSSVEFYASSKPNRRDNLNFAEFNQFAEAALNAGYKGDLRFVRSYDTNLHPSAEVVIDYFDNEIRVNVQDYVQEELETIVGLLSSLGIQEIID